jgi:tRNA threonylcarbamoyladenosine modification (KEOPS) complex Cgi121 subunit
VVSVKVLSIHSELRGKDLHAALDRLNAVAVRAGLVASEEEFELANHLAKRSFEAKTNIARSLRYEFLLWLCGKRDIKSAMKESEPDEKEFFVIVFSDTDEKEILSVLDAKSMKNNLPKVAEPLSLERISLSRVKN